MKKLYILIAAILLTVSANAQVPDQMTYQAVVRDASNNLVANTAVGIQISILKGSESGEVVYIETQQPTTNTNGLISIVIGTPPNTDLGPGLSQVDWGNDNYFIKTEIDPTGGSNYTITGTTQLLSVPYALYAKNSGDKVFSTTNNVTSNANGDVANDDFVFGSKQLDGTETRMFFDKSKGAFRVGKVNGTEWDEVNVGQYSFASGESTEASGDYSTAIGFNSTASGNYSTAMGNNTEVLGWSSTAMGSYTTASGSQSTALGFSTTASGNYSTAIGRSTTAESYAQTSLGANNIAVSGNATSFVATDRLFVIGNGSTTLNKSDALVVLKNGTITVPSLDISEITNTKSLITKEYLDANAPTGLEEITENGNVGWRLVGKDAANYGNIGIGAIDLSYSNNASTTRGATGIVSTAMGFRTTASGLYSTAMGEITEASGSQSTAMGLRTTASGNRSVAMGIGTTAETYAQTSLGSYNTQIVGTADNFIATDRLFVIGNGTSSNKSDAMVILKNGNTTINGNLYVNEVNATDSGNADMKAYMYGLVRNTGTIDTASSDGFTITKTGTGSYTINFNNSPDGFDKYIVMASLYGSNGIGFIRMERQSASITVNTYDTSGTLADKYFSFIVYKK